MANAFTTPEPVKEEECNHKICLDLDFLAESDEDSDSEIVRQMFSYVENQRKRKLEEDEEEVDLYSPPSMAFKSISFVYQRFTLVLLLQRISINGRIHITCIKRIMMLEASIEKALK